MKRSPIKRRPVKARASWKRRDDDKVTPQLRQFILARDGRCMAPVLDRSLDTTCADQFGNYLENGSYSALQRLQLDHVPGKNESGMGSRAPSDKEHLIAICPKHHLFGWATSKYGRDLERGYLTSLYPASQTLDQP